VSNNPSSGQIERRLTTLLPSTALEDHAEAVGVIEREGKLQIPPLVWSFAFGFATGESRTLAAFRRSYKSTADKPLSPGGYYQRLTPSLAECLCDLVEYRDVLIADATIVSLYQDAADVYAATGENQAELKLHFIESLSTGFPTRFRTTDGTTHERSQLPTGEWVADALILLDLGFYDFWLFDRIDQNGGWFVPRAKDNANFEIVEEPRTWRGNSIPLEGESLQAVLDNLQRQEIDIRTTLSFDRTRGSGASATRTFRLTGLCNEETGEYHLYLMNLGKDDCSAPDRAARYRARWEVELLFKESKSRFGLYEINTTDAYIIGTLIIMAAIPLLMSRVTVDELRSLEARQ